MRILAKAPPMPIDSLLLYLSAEYEHEVKTLTYMGDMAMYAAAGNVKEPNKLPRLHEMIYKTDTPKKKIKKYTSLDVINEFRGAANEII